MQNSENLDEGSEMMAILNTKDERIIYLDYNATVPPKQDILKLASDLQSKYWFNPNSAYKQGREVRKLIDKAREQCATAIGAKPEQIFFTSCASESNAMVIQYGFYAGERNVNSPFEHADIMENRLSHNLLFSEISFSDYDLWSWLLVNNESGRISIDQIHRQRERNPCCKIHSDMSQAFGKIPINVKDLDVDFATFSSQKIGSIRGCSVLYVKDPKKFERDCEPLIYGHQERGMRGGTENTVAIACMGAAMERYGYTELIDDWYKSLKQNLIAGLSQIPDTVILNTDTHTNKFTNNVVQASFKGVGSESLVLLCDSKGLCISGGAACNSESLEPSNEVKYLCSLQDPNKVNPYGVVRISYGWDTSAFDIEEAIKIIKESVESLRAVNDYRNK